MRFKEGEKMKYALGCFKDKEDKRDFIFKPII